MKKYFCVSDIHSFAGYLERDLKAAGFRKSNKDHVLIVLGDLFDRGSDTVGTYEFIKSIPKSRRILIKGNHEQLYFDLLEKDMPEKYDYSNGTVKSFCDIAGLDRAFDYYSLFDFDFDYNKFKETWQQVKEKVKNHEITKWLKSKEWLDYYELDNYIFVHSFIPLKVKEIPETKWCRHWPTHRLNLEYLEPVPDWRNKANSVEWEDAHWGCPWRQFAAGLFDEEKKNGKILVCGHWHASQFYELDGEKHDEYKGEMYNNHGLIGLDACTVLSKKINVFVFEK